MHLLTLILLLMSFDFIENVREENPNSILALYNESIYFIVTTLTTVGYGDLSASGSTSSSQMVTIWLEFIGIIIHGYGMQKVKFILDKTQVVNKAREDKVRIFFIIFIYIKNTFKFSIK